jgi:hypothetical protein
MNIIFLVVIICSLFLLLRPKRDWFIVEVRHCSDDKLCHHGFSIAGFNSTAANAHGLTIETHSSASVVLKHTDGGEITFRQTVFDNIHAATMFFETEKAALPSAPFRKIFLVRVVARLRRSAMTLPPQTIWQKQGAVLMLHQD